MWKLTCKTSGNTYYMLKEKKKYVVGRSSDSANLILNNDVSISRCHAHLYPNDDHVKVIDNDSKYGTFCNENIDYKKRMAKNEAINLKNGERVRFGLFDNEWILSQVNLQTMMSTISTTERNDLKEIFKKLNVGIIEEFTPHCTHLTMPTVTVTVKLLHALVEYIPIVNCKFWHDYYGNLSQHIAPPNHENYIPEVNEQFLKFDKELLKPNERRKTLFSGKTFVFISKKHYDTYLTIITKAGGTTKTLHEGVTKSFLRQKDVVVIKHVSSVQNQQSQQTSQILNNIEGYLQSISSRMIPEYEIGLALIHCSIEKHCNPKLNRIDHICDPANNADAMAVDTELAEETPVQRSPVYTQNLRTETISDTNSMQSKDLVNNSEKNQLNSSLIVIDDIHLSDIINDVDEVDKVSIEKEQELIITEKTIDKKRKRKSTEMECVKKTCRVNLKKINVPISETSKKTESCSAEKSKSSNAEKSESCSAERTNGYLNCSRIVRNPEVNQIEQIEIRPERKRGRFALCSDDEDDNENLFDFKKKKSKPNLSDEENCVDENIAPVNKTITNLSKLPEKKIKPKREPLQIDGWLSAKFMKLEFLEACRSNEEFDAEKSAKRVADIIKTELQMSVKPSNSSISSHNVNLSTGRGKVFVKQIFKKECTEIVQTKSFIIQGFSF